MAIAGDKKLRVFSGGQPVATASPSQAVTFTDYSGSITTGGSSQQVIADNTARRYLFIQNISSDDLWLRFGQAAVADQPSIKLIPNATFELSASTVPTGTVNLLGANTGQKFVVKEL